MATAKDQIAVQTSAAESESSTPSQAQVQAQTAHSKNAPVTVTEPGQDGGEGTTGDQVDTQKKGFLAYFKTREFYITLVLGYAHHSKCMMYVQD